MQKLTLTAAIALLIATPALAQDAGSAMAKFTGANGSDAGTVTLTQGADGVTLDGTITTVIPGAHGLHLSQTGTCAESSGVAENEQGDWINLGEVQADGQGNVTVELTSDDISLTEGEAGYVFDADGSTLILDNGDNNTSAASDTTGTTTDTAASTDATTTDTTSTDTTAAEGTSTDATTEAPADVEETPATSSGEAVLCAVIEAGSAQ